MHKAGTKLQYLALQLAEKAEVVAENTELLLNTKERRSLHNVSSPPLPSLPWYFFW